MAGEVGLAWYYDFIYWFGSNQTHGNARSAQEYMEVSGHGVPKYKLGPTLTGALPTLTLIADFLIRGLDSLFTTFRIEDAGTIPALKKRYEETFGAGETPLR
jgi:hypothetical protein